MYFQQIHQKELSINSYFIGDATTQTAAVIDPPRDIEPILAIANHGKWKITEILETHIHADFISGSKELKAHYDGLPRIHASGMGGPEWTPRYVDHAVHEGDMLLLGSVRLEARHTPGHTPEHLIWLVYDGNKSDAIPHDILTGDLLFVGSIGRPDLLGEDYFIPLAQELYKSLFERLAAFPDRVLIHPAHGAGSLCGKMISDAPSSTLGAERKNNPLLQKVPFEQWLELIKHEMPYPPAAFKRIKQINLEGAPLLSSLPTQTLQGDELVVDLRDQISFASGHLEGSLNLPLGSSFLNWAGMILPGDQPLELIIPDNANPEGIARRFHLVGLDLIKGIRTWDEVPHDHVHQLPLLEPQDAKPEKYYIVDVRSPAEWGRKHIPGAHHIELAALSEKLKDIPRDAEIATICGGGMRSSIAASYLKQQGYAHVSSVRGGMQAYSSLA